MYNQQDTNYDEVNQKILLKTLLKTGKILFRALKGFLGPVIQVLLFKAFAVLGVLFLGLLVLAFVFILPQYIIEEKIDSGKATIVSLFNFGDEKLSGWSEEDDQKLQKRYVDLTESWRKGLTEYQQEQAEDYALSWAVLAAVDRVMGDPAFNPEVKEKKIIPQPEKHYEMLKPEFTWKESTIKRVFEWKEKKIKNSKGETEIVNRKKTETEKVMLLVTANTYESDYVYEYETVTYSTGKAGLDSKRIIESKEVVKTVQETGPYYQPLSNLLDEYDIDGQEQTNLEFILELATVYDKDYEYSLGERWLSLNSSIDFTKSKFNSDIGTIIWPLDQHYTRVSSSYGYRIHPITKKRKLHTGIDLPAPKGTPIYAIGNGYVIFAGRQKVYGNVVVIDHGKGLFSLYGHMSKLNTKAKTIVQTGDIIGFVGTTGYSTGNHLHYEIRDVQSESINYINPITLYQ